MEFSTGFADDDGFDSYDPEESGLLRNTFTKSYTPYMQQYMRPVAGILLVTLAIACVSHLSSAIGFNSTQSDVGLLKYQSITKGRQPVKEGCVALYGEDPDQNPNTVAFVICNDVNDENAYEESKGKINMEGASIDISDVGFNPYDPTKGLSFVETGPNCWIILYTKPHFAGLHLEVGPNQYLNLQYSPKGDWNNKAVSLQTHKLAGDVAFLLKASTSVAGDHCAILYGSNPKEKPNTIGVELCRGAKTRDIDAIFTYAMLTKQKFKIDKMANGVSYIVTGKNCELTAYSGKINDGSSLVVPPGKELDLTEVVNQDAATDPAGRLTWNDMPMSFILRVSPRPMDNGHDETTINLRR